MCNLSVQVPDAVVLSLNETVDGLESYLKKLMAADLFKKHLISLGYGAEIAGLSEEEFIYELGKAGISVFHFENDAEFDEELKNA